MGLGEWHMRGAKRFIHWLSIYSIDLGLHALERPIDLLNFWPPCSRSSIGAVSARFPLKELAATGIHL